MRGLGWFKVLASLTVISIVLSLPILQSHTQPLYPVYSSSGSDDSCYYPTQLLKGLGNITILNFVNVTSIRPLRFDVTALNLNLSKLLSNITCTSCSQPPSNLQYEVQLNVILNETRGRFGTLFLEARARAYNETYSIETRAYILMHKANVTHGIVEIATVLKPTSTGEAYETVSIIADYKPLEDKPTKLADIIYLNTTTLNTEMKLSQAIRTIATVVDRISNNYEKSNNETLKLQAKAYKTIAAQLRIIASYFESKLKEYNKNVEAITTLVADWFIPWCDLCIFVCGLILGALLGGYGCYGACGSIAVGCGPFAGACFSICFAICTGAAVMAAVHGCCPVCRSLGFCSRC
jgi:rubrerythrin